MDLKKEFNDLAKKYTLKYKYQEFENCFGGNWWVCTHSLYNESGCFTIHCLPQRGEVDFYYTEKFSDNRKELCGKSINVFEVEKEIWEKKKKIWIFKNPFYFMNPERIIETLIEVIKVSIEKNNEFFGIKAIKIETKIDIAQENFKKAMLAMDIVVFESFYYYTESHKDCIFFIFFKTEEELKSFSKEQLNNFKSLYIQLLKETGVLPKYIWRYEFCFGSDEDVQKNYNGNYFYATL